MSSFSLVTHIPKVYVYLFKNPVSFCTLVEHAAVNRRVVGSSPTGGANEKPLLL